MNLNLDIGTVQKTPNGFYYDSGLETENNCTVHLTEGVEKMEIIFNKQQNNTVYDCYMCLVNSICVGRPMMMEFTFTLFHDLEFNTYHLMNDFENCSDEFPRDNVTLIELDCFPEILKLFFINPPEYVGMMM